MILLGFVFLFGWCIVGLFVVVCWLLG